MACLMKLLVNYPPRTNGSYSLMFFTYLPTDELKYIALIMQYNNLYRVRVLPLFSFIHLSRAYSALTPLQIMVKYGTVMSERAVKLNFPALNRGLF